MSVRLKFGCLGPPRLSRFPIYTNFCIVPEDQCKLLRFCGSALDDLREFPLSARRDAGYQLDQVQRGRDPDDWKPVNTIGQGVREIRIRDANGAFQIILQHRPKIRWRQRSPPLRHRRDAVRATSQLSRTPADRRLIWASFRVGTRSCPSRPHSCHD
ncbi:type II toxin-antitoxin system RelE/ParE family toxin, partial [Paraburkholderia sp.]|uniref:type II toxin-antitoxin system RelE/ParE family toxin n=1 Tax=Paraburkholderia sp. TaxID=1926495 RepID=UPI002D34827B